MTTGKSKWGSLLSGAVAGLESRLDTILASEEGPALAKSQQPERARPLASLGKAQERVSSEARSEKGISRASSVRRAAEPRVSTSSDAPAKSTEVSVDVKTPAEQSAVVLEPDSKPPTPSIRVENVDPLDNILLVPAEEARRSIDTIDTEAEQTASSLAQSGTSTATDIQEGENHMVELVEEETDQLPAQETDGSVAQLRLEIEKKELEHQEELHAYLERVDALQAKLQYLAREAADSAKKVASDAPKDSLAQKLAAKDEQIAALLDEGQRLSKTEVGHASTVRRLRVRIADDGRTLAELKAKVTKAEVTSAQQAQRITRLEAGKRDATLKVARLARSEKDLEDLKAQRTANKATIEALRSQLEEANKQAEIDVKQRVVEVQEKEQKLNQSLKEDLANAKIERQLAEERARNDLRASRDELLREKERHKSAEAELNSEISILEGRLELFKVRTEEVTSGVTNESQAKLMRQVEMLQSQYALASENWHGIESSLQTRLTTVEKERNDAARLESETRRKARDAASTSRRTQEEVDELARKCQILEHDMQERQSYAERLQVRAKELEKSLKDARQEFERDRQSWEATMLSRIEEEKHKLRQELAERAYIKTDSPTASFKRVSNLDIPSLSSPGLLRRGYNRQASADLQLGSLDRPASRRSSNVRPLKTPDMLSPNLDSGRSTPFFANLPTEAQSITEADESVADGSSPHRTVNDMISGSTAGAGPSVQLVERMSAAVRRLESEKAASKDEMTRLSTQRDQARKEVVNLLREVEEKRAGDTRIEKLEAEMSQVTKRYQTTLELLGEKSERVEELEADVSDLKKIYRELIDNTMK